MRVLITGAGGKLGRDLVATCHEAGDDLIAADRAALDVTDRDAVLGAITVLRPDVVIHTAAWTAVDACESEPDRAWRTNALAVRYVADGCRRADAHLVHISTDYVFSGEQDEPYTEWHIPDPLSIYGRSKLGGELEAGPDATIVRTSWLCGQHGSNMVKTVLQLSAEMDSLAFVDDQRGHPTFTADLAPMVRRLAIDRRPGLHHVTNQGETTWFELAREVVAAAGRDPAMVHPITTDELRPTRPAPRPANSVLDNAALRLGGIPLLDDHRNALARLVRVLTA